MPTSGTGATEARTRGAAPAHGAGARGFTLLELLVVLAIVSVVAGMAVLATGGMGGRRLEHAARSTEALLAHACERAALTGRDVGIALVAGGLRFGYLAPQGFQPLRDDPADPLRPRMLDETVRLILSRDGDVLSPQPDPPSAPQLACFASGELTPFTLVLEAHDSSERWQLAGTLDGSLRLERTDAR